MPARVQGHHPVARRQSRREPVEATGVIEEAMAEYDGRGLGVTPLVQAQTYIARRQPALAQGRDCVGMDRLDHETRQHTGQRSPASSRFAFDVVHSMANSMRGADGR
jgi:hypothetical protein